MKTCTLVGSFGEMDLGQPRQSSETGSETCVLGVSRCQIVRKVIRPYLFLAALIVGYWMLRSGIDEQTQYLPANLLAAVGFAGLFLLFARVENTLGKIVIAICANVGFFLIDLLQPDPARDEFFYLIGLGGGFILFSSDTERPRLYLFACLPFAMNLLEEVISYTLLETVAAIKDHWHFLEFATVYAIVFSQFWIFSQSSNLDAESLKKALRERNRLFDVKRVFLSRTAHDLNNELASIRFVLQNMTGERPALSISAATDMIQSSTDVLGGMIDDVVRTLSIEIEDVSLKPDRVETGPYLENLYRSALIGIIRSEMRTRLTMDPWVPRVITIDPLRLRQIIFNLVGNAVKYGKPDDLQIRPMICMHVGYDPDTEDLSITISDNGPGIPEDMFEKVFEHQFRLARDITKTTQGLGIGLGSSRNIARQMQGDLVPSRLPSGCMAFTVRVHAPVIDGDPFIEPFGEGRLISCQCQRETEETELLRSLVESWGFSWEYGQRHEATDFNPDAAVSIIIGENMLEARRRLGREIQSLTLPVIFGLYQPWVYFVSQEQIFSVSPIYPTELKRELERLLDMSAQANVQAI